MAQIVKKDNALEKKYRTSRAVAIAAGIVCAALLTAFATTGGAGATVGSVGVTPIILLVCFAVSGVVGGHMMEQARILQMGIEGESVTANVVKTLPNNYIGFQNVVLQHEKGTSELDMVVVGPTGVFVIETKNLNGTVVGNYEGREWVQKKHGRGGTPYSKGLYSPVKQVRTHVHHLAEFLGKNGINTYIKSAVYFANPDAVVQMLGTPAGTPVFSALTGGVSELRGYLTAADSHTLTHEQVTRIAALLNQ